MKHESSKYFSGWSIFATGDPGDWGYWILGLQKGISIRIRIELTFPLALVTCDLIKQQRKVERPKCDSTVRLPE